MKNLTGTTKTPIPIPVVAAAVVAAHVMRSGMMRMNDEWPDFIGQE